MADRDRYISLICSLPEPERLFRAKQPPLSRIRLDRRLTALDPQDRQTLRQVEQFMSWGNYQMSDTDQTSIRRGRALLSDLDSTTLRAILNERLDLRATIAAFRMRRQGGAAPSQPWSASRLTRHIIANWSDPTFALAERLPWIAETQARLEQRDPLGLERHILDVTHRQLQRHAARHTFDLEAVVIYVLKWSIFDRWARSDARAAAARFERLAHAALASFETRDLEGLAR